MSKYSTTINFFLSEEIVNRLKKVQIKEDITIDWRYPNLCHVTVKAISLSNEIPAKNILMNWVDCTKIILQKQNPFTVKLEGLFSFPNTIYINGNSEKLKSLHRSLCEVLPSSQPQFEDLNYTPHCSIVTLKKAIKPQTFNNNDFGVFEVKQMELVIWDLDNINKPIIFQKFLLQKS